MTAATLDTLGLLRSAIAARLPEGGRAPFLAATAGGNPAWVEGRFMAWLLQPRRAIPGRPEIARESGRGAAWLSLLWSWQAVGVTDPVEWEAARDAVFARTSRRPGAIARRAWPGGRWNGWLLARYASEAAIGALDRSPDPAALAGAMASELVDLSRGRTA